MNTIAYDADVEPIETNTTVDLWVSGLSAAAILTVWTMVLLLLGQAMAERAAPDEPVGEPGEGVLRLGELDRGDFAVPADQFRG